MVKSTYKKIPSNPTPITPEFTAGSLTNYGGLAALSDFLFDKLGFEAALSDQVDFGMGSNCSYSDGQVMGLILFGYLCGYSRLSHFEQLSRDRLVQTLLGLSGPIDENTLAYRLKKAGKRQSVQLDRATHQLASRTHREARETSHRWRFVDMDSSVKGVYGHQQGAGVGYNPTRKGQRSYHPLLAFMADTKEVIHSWWRTGKAYTANGAAEFFTELCGRLPDPTARYVIRADSGFFGDRFLSTIEAAGHDYLVKVKLKNLKPLLTSQDWQRIPGQPGTQYCEFSHTCQGWEAPRKVVGIRVLTSLERDGWLFPQKQYDYFCYVTSLQEAPLEVHRLYGDRGECENWIQEVKVQMEAGTTLTNHFWANALLWQLAVLAYNLTLWLRRLAGSESHRQEPQTFREWFIRCAGKLVYHARRWTLKMQASYPWRSQWEAIYQKTCRLQL